MQQLYIVQTMNNPRTSRIRPGEWRRLHGTKPMSEDAAREMISRYERLGLAYLRAIKV